MPTALDFDLRDPGAWPILADALQEDGAEHLPEYLRDPFVIGVPDPFREEWEDRFRGARLHDNRYTMSFWVEPQRCEPPYIGVYFIPAREWYLSYWAAVLVDRKWRRITGPWAESPEGAVVCLLGKLTELKCPLRAIDRIYGRATPVRTCVRFAFEPQPWWWGIW